jgi:nucleoside-diphosphate-sugar epimerase
VTAPDVRGRRVLVTGATGFVGSHVVRRLLAGGAEVVAMSSSVSATVPPRLADVIDDVQIVDANVSDVSSLAHAVEVSRPELVVHLAAFTHVGRSFYRVDENIQTNIQGTVNLLQALDGAFERLVYVGSGDVYGDGQIPFREDQPVAPVSPYAVSKYAAERFCRMYHQAHGWPIVCLRPFNTFGPWQSVDRVVPELIVAGLKGERLPMTEGSQTREFTYVADVADAVVLALTRPGVAGEVLNIGRGEEVSMRTLALTIVELLGSGLQPDFGALPPRPNEIPRMVSDSSRARTMLGWEAAYTLEDALDRTVAWYREQLHGDVDLRF